MGEEQNNARLVQGLAEALRGLNVNTARQFNGPLLPIEKYNGEEAKLFDFIAEYDTSTDAHGWNTQEKIKRLPSYLNGYALNVCKFLPPVIGETWEAFKTRFINEVAGEDVKTVSKKAFLRRDQRKFESAAQYYYELKALVGRIHAGENNDNIDETMENEVKNRFRRGLRKEIKSVISVCNDDLTMADLLKKARAIEKSLTEDDDIKICNINRVNFVKEGSSNEVKIDDRGRRFESTNNRSPATSRDNSLNKIRYRQNEKYDFYNNKNNSYNSNNNFINKNNNKFSPYSNFNKNNEKSFYNNRNNYDKNNNFNYKPNNKSNRNSNERYNFGSDSIQRDRLNTRGDIKCF